MSFKDYLANSFENFRSQIEKELEEKIQEFVENLPVQGHPFADDLEIFFDETYSQREKNVYELKISGSFGIKTIDPMDKDQVSISSGSFEATYVFRHPGGKNYLEPEFENIAISDGRND